MAWAASSPSLGASSNWEIVEFYPYSTMPTWFFPMLPWWNLWPTQDHSKIPSTSLFPMMRASFNWFLSFIGAATEPHFAFLCLILFRFWSTMARQFGLSLVLDLGNIEGFLLCKNALEWCFIHAEFWAALFQLSVWGVISKTWSKFDFFRQAQSKIFFHMCFSFLNPHFYDWFTFAPQFSHLLRFYALGIGLTKVDFMFDVA